MKTFEEKLQKPLLKKFHTICGSLGINESEKKQLISGYGVDSSRDLSARDLIDICNKLEADSKPEVIKLDTERKRVFGAIGGWFDLIYGKVSKSDTSKYNKRIKLIKATACRQTGHDTFNAIPVERLRNIYHTFSNKQKDYRAGKQIMADELSALASLN